MSQFNPPIKTNMFATINFLMAPNQDKVVRLTSATTLRVYVDEWTADFPQFAPFIGESIELLIQLLRELEDFENQMLVIEVLSYVIDRMGRDYAPYCDSLLQLLPLLWQESEGHNMYRSSLVSVIAKVVNVKIIKFFKSKGFEGKLQRFAFNSRANDCIWR